MVRRSGDFTIGSLSRRTAVNIETIRYYERAGLMPAPPRTSGGHRLYGSDHERRLKFIRRSRELGFSVDEVRALLGLVDGGYTCGEVQALTLKHLAEVRKKVADLQRLEATLADISSRCEGGKLPDCPVVEALLGETHFIAS